VPDLTLGDGRVVESLKLRVPLNSMRSSLQSWPVSGAHSTAATFDFAAPTAPASFSVAATSATRNSALPRASNTPRDSAHASSLLGLRASAVLLVSCGDFRKELVRTEDNADNKSCSCCSSPHSNNETTVDPGLTSIFPAVIAVLFPLKENMQVFDYYSCSFFVSIYNVRDLFKLLFTLL